MAALVERFSAGIDTQSAQIAVDPELDLEIGLLRERRSDCVGNGLGDPLGGGPLVVDLGL